MTPTRAKTPTPLKRGPGARQPPGPTPEWQGREAQRYTALTLAHYGTTCWLCGLPGATTADHVIPRSRGGAVYDLANLAPAHKRCNESRGNRDAAGADAFIEHGAGFFRP
ncbi:HNH endonuclease [Pseudoclavibacter albus]|uniref:HNH endonuclease n=1 Tax=Pseudoclavibacter albus TaxID=272241 RepID=UPI0035CCEFD0